MQTAVLEFCRNNWMLDLNQQLSWKEKIIHVWLESSDLPEHARWGSRCFLFCSGKRTTKLEFCSKADVARQSVFLAEWVRKPAKPQLARIRKSEGNYENPIPFRKTSRAVRIYEKNTGSFFFEDSKCQAVTVIEQRYQDRLTDFLTQAIDEMNVSKHFYQLDESTCPTTRDDRAFFCWKFYLTIWRSWGAN